MTQRLSQCASKPKDLFDASSIRQINMRIATEKDTVATKPTFPGLPTEIHRLIYEELFSDKKEQRIDHPVLRVSKDIYAMCRPILLSRLQLLITFHSGFEDEQNWGMTLRFIFNNPWTEGDFWSREYERHKLHEKPELIALLSGVRTILIGGWADWTSACYHTEYWSTVQLRSNKSSGQAIVEHGKSILKDQDIPEHDEQMIRRERAVARASEASVCTMELLKEIEDVVCEYGYLNR